MDTGSILILELRRPINFMNRYLNFHNDEQSFPTSIIAMKTAISYKISSLISLFSSEGKRGK